jgi:hypothetical protein
VPFVLHPRRDDKATLIVHMLTKNHGHQVGRGLSLLAFVPASLRFIWCSLLKGVGDAVI